MFAQTLNLISKLNIACVQQNVNRFFAFFDLILVTVLLQISINWQNIWKFAVRGASNYATDCRILWKICAKKQGRCCQRSLYKILFGKTPRGRDNKKISSSRPPAQFGQSADNPVHLWRTHGLCDSCQTFTTSLSGHKEPESNIFYVLVQFLILQAEQHLSHTPEYLPVGSLRSRKSPLG